MAQLQSTTISKPRHKSKPKSKPSPQRPLTSLTTVNSKDIPLHTSVDAPSPSIEALLLSSLPTHLSSTTLPTWLPFLAHSLQASDTEGTISALILALRQVKRLENELDYEKRLRVWWMSRCAAVEEDGRQKEAESLKEAGGGGGGGGGSRKKKKGEKDKERKAKRKAVEVEPGSEMDMKKPKKRSAEVWDVRPPVSKKVKVMKHDDDAEALHAAAYEHTHIDELESMEAMKYSEVVFAGDEARARGWNAINRFEPPHGVNYGGVGQGPQELARKALLDAVIQKEILKEVESEDESDNSEEEEVEVEE